MVIMSKLALGEEGGGLMVCWEIPYIESHWKYRTNHLYQEKLIHKILDLIYNCFNKNLPKTRQLIELIDLGDDKEEEEIVRTSKVRDEYKTDLEKDPEIDLFYFINVLW